MKQRSRHLPGFVLVLLLLAIVVVSWFYPPTEWIPTQRWSQQLEQAGLQGMLMFIGAGLLATSIGLPRQLLAVIGGLSYGVATGMVLSLLAAIGGCLLTVLVSRYLLADFIHDRYPRIVATLNRIIKKDTFLKIIVLRLQPFGTNLISNVCAGVSNINLRIFLSASLLGYIPQMLVFTLIGSGIRVGSSTQLFISALLLLASLVLGAYLYRRHRIH